ncbi:MAG: hypothetical protein RL302_1176 [Pseudomonadota bacterium]|jgi:protein TonB
MNRKIIIVISVLAFHAAALWAVQTGLLRRVSEALLPPEILVMVMDPAAPTAPQAKMPPAPAKAAAPAPRAAPTAAPLAVQETATAPTLNTSTAPTTPAPIAALASNTAVVSSATPTTTPTPHTQAAPKVELPSSDADYLNNPKPPYPPLSKRLGEQGKVVVHTLIGADGVAQKADIKQSSGFDRLDQAAVATALRWRYVPGKRAGVPEAMWFNVPFNFVLE